MARVLIVDQDRAFYESLGAIISGLGHRTHHAPTLQDGLNHTASSSMDVVFLNTALPDGNGIDALHHFRTLAGKPEVIMITDAGDPDGAERAIRGGAWEYVEKRGSVDRMVLPLIRALEYRGRKPTKREEVRLKRDAVVGSGPGITRCLDIVAEAATSDASTLLYGETGVGKEVFARAIHDNSSRAGCPFVAVDCASLSRTLAGSILFGHRKGAFTGADKDRDGLVAQAHKGTLFLDEVGELPLPMQKIFLRVLQEHRFRPVGGRNEVTSDFRLICATNRNLEEMVARGTFRSDLLFRMRTVVMPIPPLRERTEDIPELTKHYLRRHCGKYGMPTKGISPDCIDTLKSYHWPGNVRELIHTLERAVLAAQDDPKLFSRHLPDHLRISIARAAVDKPTEPIHDDFAPVEPPASETNNSRNPTPTQKPQAPSATSGDMENAGDPPPLRPGASCELPDSENGTTFGSSESEDRTPSSITDDKISKPSPITDILSAATELPLFFEFRDQAFTTYLTELMAQSSGKIPVACELSGLSRSYLYDLLKKYSIDK